jgi:hypothetical protein
MRAFDATGMGFLENYIGPTYARLLASLKDRQAVVFGRGSSCQTPLIVDLNDTDAFCTGFWEPIAARIPVTTPPDTMTAEAPPFEAARDHDGLDDLPF